MTQTPYSSSPRRRQPWGTYTILAVNVAVFLVELGLNWYLTGRPSTNLHSGVLLLMGAKYNSAILSGEIWRFFTPMLLHADLEHLFFNSMSLFIWGRMLEGLLGHGRFFLVYLVSGLVGAAASFAFSPALAVGASGAIFGLFGALLCFRSRYKEIFNRVFGAQVVLLIVINLGYGFLSANIDNFGHLGGLIGGFLTCFAVGFKGERKTNRHFLWALPALLAASAALLYIGYIRW